MTIYYIDPTCTVSGTGTSQVCDTEDGPFKTALDVTISSNNTYLWKYGTIDTQTRTEISLDRLKANGIDNVIFGAYGDPIDGNPIIQWHHATTEEDWTDEGDNVWSIENDSEFSRRYYVIGFGSLSNPGERVQSFASVAYPPQVSINSEKKWNSSTYSADPATSNKLYVYSEGNPNTFYGGPVYYTTSQNYGIYLLNSTNITISNIDFRYLFRGIFIFNSIDGTYGPYEISNCNFQNCGLSGIAISGNSNRTGVVDIHDNQFTDMLGNGIYISNSAYSSEIYENTFDNCGISVSTASIYIGELSNTEEQKIIVRHNTALNQNFAKYWPSDGACFFQDGNTKYIDWYSNIAKDSYIGFSSNAGAAGGKFFNNLTLNCVKGFNGNDSENIGNHDTLVANNTFMATESPIILSGHSLDIFTVKNNIIYNSDGNYGINVNSDIAASLIEENNSFYGYSTYSMINRSTSIEISIDGNSIISDPLLTTEGKLSRSSPAIDAGTTIPGVTDIGTLDPWGYGVFGQAPNIGADQRYGRVISGAELHHKFTPLFNPADTTEEGSIIQVNETTPLLVHTADGEFEINDGTTANALDLDYEKDTEYTLKIPYGDNSGTDQMQIISGESESTLASFDGSFDPDEYIGWGASDFPLSHNLTRIYKKIRSW